jgi:hypothetical protein
MTTYTPSTNVPTSKFMNITNSLIVSPSATGPFSIFAVSDSFTSLPNSQYNWSTTVASQVLTLPLTPINGAYVIINDIDWSWGNFPPSINYNTGASSKGAVANATDLSLYAGAEIKFIYNSTSNEWTSYLKPVSTDDPFQGWWKNVSKSVFYSGATDDQVAGVEPLPSGYTLSAYSDANVDNVPYIYLDVVTNYPLVKITTYGGTYDNVFEALKFESTYERLDDGISLAYPGLPGTSSFDFTNFLARPSYAPNTLTLQTGGQIFGQYSSTTDPDFVLGNICENAYSCILQKMSSAPVIRPYSENEVSFTDVQDPIFMFKYFAKIMSEKGMPQTNSLNGVDTWYPGYYNQNAILQSYLNGKTIEYDVYHIIKSTTEQYSNEDILLSNGNLTGATKIFIGLNHLVTPGSTVTINGLTGDWNTINGEYINDVIYSSHWNNQSTGHMDCNVSDTTSNLTGSLYNSTNFCVLRLDTSSFTGISSGAYNGWASYTGNPTISVTHHVTSNMSYNNFIGALKAFVLEVYGSQEHASYSSAIKEDNSNRVEESWESISTNYLINNFQDWVSKFGLSSFYNSYYTPSSVQSIYGDHYDVLNTEVTYITGANTGGWSISTLNYLDPNETYNLYYAFTGDFSTGPAGTVENVAGQIQEYFGTLSNTVNVANPSQTGGSVLIYTGAKYAGNNDADRTVWNIMGSINTLNEDEETAYNLFVYGLVKSELTDGKNIGYILANNSLPFVDGADSIWYYQGNTWADPQILQNAPDKFSGGVWANAMVPVMKYFNSKQVDTIILDNRTNLGGFEGWFEQFFGGDRLKTSKNYFNLNTQNGLSSTLDIQNFDYYDNINLTGADNYLHPSFLESNLAYGTGAVFHGTTQTGARIVLLQGETSYSSGNLRMWNMLGDNSDGDIGNYTNVKILGCNKAYFSSFTYGKVFLTPAPYITESIVGTSTIYTSVYPEGTIPYYKLSTGMSGAITLNPTYQITETTAVDAMTSLTGAFSNSLGNPFPMDLETRVYPDFGFVENIRPRLPGDNRPQQPDPTVSGTWRDSWLEAAIGESVYGTW